MGAAYVVVAWLAIQVVETIFPAFGFGDAAVRFITIAFAVGIIPVLVFTWVFEFTPEGLRFDRDVEHDPVASRRTTRRLDRIILVVLALALGYFAFERFVLVPERTARQLETAREEGRNEALIESYGEQSIAVLAFEDMSAEGDQVYLAEGIAEEVLNLLARIPDLRVISRSSAFSYKDKDVAIPTIAEQLNVAHILEGSVRKSGNRIRVTAQLIDARSDTHLWSETYDRELGDIFAIQDDLAAALADELHITLLGSPPQAEPIDPEAYDLFLQAKYFEDVGGGDVVELLEKVVALAPEFAEGWAHLSQAYINSAPSLLSTANRDDDPVWQKALAARQKVIDLDPDHSFVLITSAWKTLEEDSNYAEAARLFQRALRLYPEKEEVLRPTADFANMIHQIDLAVELSRILVGQDPLCSRCAYNYARHLMRAGRYDEAEQAIMRYSKVLPAKGGELTLGTIRVLAGDYPGAEEAFQQREDEIGRAFGALLVRAARGDDGVLADIQQFGEQESYLHPWAMASLYAMVDEKDAAFEWLETASKTVPNWQLAYQLTEPMLESLHFDPRWLELQTRAGVAPDQLAEIEFDPRLPQLDLSSQ